MSTDANDSNQKRFFDINLWPLWPETEFEIDWLSTFGYLDRRRVQSTGVSAGSHFVIRSVCAPNTVLCAVYWTRIYRFHFRPSALLRAWFCSTKWWMTTIYTNRFCTVEFPNKEETATSPQILILFLMLMRSNKILNKRKRFNLSCTYMYIT